VTAGDRAGGNGRRCRVIPPAIPSVGDAFLLLQAGLDERTPSER
jgi:hypothetical protein